MKLKLFKIFWLVGVLMISSSFKHPLKLTASLIEYNPETTSLRMECKVFIDDFEDTINKKDFDVSNLSKEDKEEIEFYFNQFYRIVINGKKIPLKYKESEVQKGYNILVIKFAENDIKIKKGDFLYIENKLFFEKFGSLQTNRVVIRFPPFIIGKRFQTTSKNYSISHNF